MTTPCNSLVMTTKMEWIAGSKLNFFSKWNILEPLSWLSTSLCCDQRVVEMRTSKNIFFRRILSGAKNSHLKHVEQKNPTILSCFFISFYFIFYFRSSLLSELLRMNKKERKKELKRTGGFSILIDARNTNERCCCIILPHSLLLPY